MGNNIGNILLKFLIILLVLLTIGGIVIYFNYNKFIISDNTTLNNEVLNTNSEIEEPVPDISFTIAAIGDVMCHNTQYMDAYVSSTGEYNFNYVFDEVKDYTSSADLTIGSLETVFAGSDVGYSNYPTFNSPDALAYSLSDIGVDVLSTAGNHALDKGFSGLSRTIDVLNDAGISNVGTYKTQEDRDTVLFKDVNGVKIAIINYTYGTNGIPIPTGKEFSVNLIDKDLILQDIESAKSQEADMIIACMHWGTEYLRTANNEQIELSDFLFKNGVNVILGNHPHVIEPMEKRTVTMDDGTTRDCFVVYALGNFICDQNYKYTRNSAILNLEFTKKSNGEITIDEATYVPIYMYKDNTSNVQRMKLLDIETNIYNYENGIPPMISTSTYNLLKQELEYVTDVLGEEIISGDIDSDSSNENFSTEQI